MSKFAFIVCADIRYLPEVVANLNSLDFVGNKQDVHFYGYKIPAEVIAQFNKLSYQVFFHEITDQEVQECHGLSEVVCRKRYFYAAEIGKDYEAVCVLDADLVFVRNPIQFFVIAAKTGFILGPGKEQNKVYDDPHHQFRGEWVMEQGYYNRVDMCNCPVFIDAKVWGHALKQSWLWFITDFPEQNMKCPDMDCMNLAFLVDGSADQTLAMPALQWLGTNEQFLKPYIRVVNDHGAFKTECGILMFSYHGQFYHKKWRDNQLDARHRCAQGYLKAAEGSDSLWASDAMAAGALNLLNERFNKMLDYKIQIPRLNYRHPELPYEG